MTFLYNRGIVTIDQKWLKIRQELYRQTMEHVRFRIGRVDGEIRRALHEYQVEISKRWKISHKTELIAAVQSADIVLMGDFHALQQSQKAHLRILKSLDLKKGIEYIIAVECIHSQSQKYLDQYLSGRLTEFDFLKKIEWSKNWGFPWEHYRALFEWARINKIKILALNLHQQRGQKLTLKRRDQHMGQMIAEQLKKTPNVKIITIVGDLHLNSSSLPQTILKKLKDVQIVRVFQNSEQIYFQLLKKNLTNQIDVVRLARFDFCLMSVAPWVKWQNYLLYLEHHYDRDLDEDEDDGIDFADHIAGYIRVIESDLGLQVSTNDLSVFTANDQNLWQMISQKYQKSQIKTIEMMIEDEQSFYLPDLKIAYLARASVNHAAALAMQFVYFQINSIESYPLHFSNDFYRLIWLEAMSYFGSKLINPKRKTDTLQDMKASLAKKNQLNVGKESLQLAIAQKMSEMMYLTERKTLRKLPKPRKTWTYFLSAQMLGSLLGEKLYYGYSEKLISKANLLKMLHYKIDQENFEVIYLQFIEIIESMPQPFKTKAEKL